MPDAHGEERRIREPGLGALGCCQVVRIHLVLAGVHVDDQEFAFVARFNPGADLIVVERLSAPHDLAAGNACLLHWGVSSLLPNSFCVRSSISSIHGRGGGVEMAGTRSIRGTGVKSRPSGSLSLPLRLSR